jgi:hypothetical protein
MESKRGFLKDLTMADGAHPLVNSKCWLDIGDMGGNLFA